MPAPSWGQVGQGQLRLTTMGRCWWARSIWSLSARCLAQKKSLQVGDNCSNSSGASSHISVIAMAFFFFFIQKHKSAVVRCASKRLASLPHGTSSPGYLTAQCLAEGDST